MKLLRYGPMGMEKPGLVDGSGKIRDLSGLVGDIGGETLSDAGLDRLRRVDAAKLPEVDASVRLGPCVGGTGKFVCIGLNYADHAAESGMSVPPEPVIFMKATSAICGPDDPVIIPRGSQKTICRSPGSRSETLSSLSTCSSSSAITTEAALKDRR